MAITPKPPGSITPPNVLGAETPGTISVPNNLTSKAAGSLTPPNSLTAEPVGSIAIPNVLGSQPVNPWPAGGSGPSPRTDYYYDFSGSGATLGREIIDIDDDFSIKFSLLGAIPTTGHIVSQASGGPSSNSLLELRLVSGDFRFLFGGTDNAPGIAATAGDWEFRLIGTNLRIIKDTVEVYNNAISRGSNEDGAVTTVGMNEVGGSSYDGIIYDVSFEALNGAPLVASSYYIDDNAPTLVDLLGVQNGTISVGYNPANWSQL